MWNILSTLFSGFWAFFKYPVYLLALFAVVFLGSVSAFYIYLRFYKGVKPIPGEWHPQRRPSFFKRIFWDLPSQYARDILARDPERFRYQGIIIFEGRQGQGKTIAMIQQAREWQKEYPKAFCLSNLNYSGADASLESWDDLIDFQNPHGSKCGLIVLNDELQNTFNSKRSKDFPMEFVGIVTQNRKNRRVLLGTAQNFYMLSKDIRSQCTELRKCFTVLGCLTIVRRFEPVCDSSGEVVKLKPRGGYFFIQSPELRECYDTYEVIKGMRRSGFKPRTEQASALADRRNGLTGGE